MPECYVHSSIQWAPVRRFWRVLGLWARTKGFRIVLAQPPHLPDNVVRRKVRMGKTAAMQLRSLAAAGVSLEAEGAYTVLVLTNADHSLIHHNMSFLAVTSLSTVRPMYGSSHGIVQEKRWS